jgi:hypothetical protein
MVGRPKGAALLHGAAAGRLATSARWSTPSLKLQRLSLDLGDDIAELDINPLMVRPLGSDGPASSRSTPRHPR